MFQNVSNLLMYPSMHIFAVLIFSSRHLLLHKAFATDKGMHEMIAFAEFYDLDWEKQQLYYALLILITYMLVLKFIEICLTVH